MELLVLVVVSGEGVYKSYCPLRGMIVVVKKNGMKEAGNKGRKGGAR